MLLPSSGAVVVERARDKEPKVQNQLQDCNLAGFGLSEEQGTCMDTCVVCHIHPRNVDAKGPRHA